MSEPRLDIGLGRGACGPQDARIDWEAWGRRRASGSQPMICPFCASENLDGADECQNCMQDLTSLDHPTGETPLEESIIRDSLAALEPKEAVFVSPETSVADAIATLQEHNIGCVLVGTVEHVAGIFSERDVLLRIAQRLETASSQPVSDFMTPDPEMLDIGTPIAYALNRMSLRDFRHLPITKNGRLAGIISLRDFLHFLNREYPELIFG